MNTLTRILIASLVLVPFAGYTAAQPWPGGEVIYDGMYDGGAACGPGCGGVAYQGGPYGPAYGGPPAPMGRMQGAAQHFQAAAQAYGMRRAQGYLPAARAYPCRPQLANPYGDYPGVGPDGGYVNYGDACCGPNWFCIAVEAVALQRDNDRDLNLASDGIVGPIVLGTGDTPFDYQAALRVTGRLQLNAVTNFEGSYLGLLDWNDSGVATSDNDGLYSVFSAFGTQPLVGIGFRETDQATRQTFDYSSELESAEGHFRRAWTTPGGCFYGSWLLGGRWIRISDDLRYTSDVQQHFNPFLGAIQGPGNLDYRIGVRNDLIGAQFGSQVGVTLLPGIFLSGQAKFGVYANRIDQRTQIDGSPNPTPPIDDPQSSTDFAYGSDLRASLIWHVNPAIKLRAGYEALLLNDLATGATAFSTDPPLTSVSTGMETGSSTFPINNDQDLIYHGFHLGLEFGW
ncbi:MAG: hypothetical protein AAGF97_11785 [Planctomycetota bacterium]